MLNDAAISAQPTKYIQNKCQGTYGGTMAVMNVPAERCSAPKTANGTAKHKLVRAAILSRPRAWPISFFAAHRPMPKSARPAAAIEKAVRENSKNAARITGCMDPPNQYSATNSTTTLASRPHGGILQFNSYEFRVAPWSFSTI